MDMHTVQIGPNEIQINAMHAQIITDILECFVYSQEWCTLFESRRMNGSCRYACSLRPRDCCVTCLMQSYNVLLSLHNLSASICHASPVVYIPCISISVSDHNWPYVLLHNTSSHLTISTEERRKQAVCIYPLWLARAFVPRKDDRTSATRPSA